MSPIEEALMGLAMAAALSLLFIAAIAAALHYFVALNAPPRARAMWTVAPAYGACALLGVLPDTGPIPFWAWPIGAFPAAALWLWFWLRDFQKRWYDSIEDIPDDVPVANHDWKNGLLTLAGAMVTALLVALARRSY